MSPPRTLSIGYCPHSVTAGLALNMTPNVDCYRVGAVSNFSTSEFSAAQGLGRLRQQRQTPVKDGLLRLRVKVV